MTGKIKWRERYNCHSFSLEPGFEIHVDWDGINKEGGYKVSVFGQTIGKFQDFAVAESVAIEYAGDALKRATAKLAQVTA